jgi:hypothetical protein
MLWGAIDIFVVYLITFNNGRTYSVLILVISLNLVSHILIKLSSPALITTVLYLKISHSFRQFIGFLCAYFLQTMYFPQINNDRSPWELPVIISDYIVLP